MKKNKFSIPDICWVSGIILIIFVFTINFIHKADYLNLTITHSWLSASTIKFTNNWLKDGVFADKFSMLEKPFSIESQTIESRRAYVSYPIGTIMVTYGVAKMVGKDQIDIRFIKELNIIFYALDALLIGLIVYLILRYILKIETRKGKIFISILLSSLWILFPNNIYYLKNVFFADQLILFFTCLLLLLEILRNYVGIANSLRKNIINILLFLIILLGVLIDYYFWVQVFILCAINFIDSLLQRKGFISSIKKMSIYVIPAILAVGLFLLQLTQISDSLTLLKSTMFRRMGQTGAALPTYLGNSYIEAIFNHMYQVFGYIGFTTLLVFTVGSLLLLCYLKIVKKKEMQLSKEICSFLKISLFIILSAYIQLFSLLNHSAIHEFSILKLNLLFVFGLLLFSYVIFILRGKSPNLALEIIFKIGNFSKKIVMNSYVVLVTILAVFFVSFNIYPKGIYSYWKNIESYNKRRMIYPLCEMALLIKEINDYENVFFSCTESIPINPPQSLAIAKKMVYKVNKLDDIKHIFPDLDNNAVLMFVINKNNIKKSNDILQEEQYVIKNFKLIKERNGYEIYSLNERIMSLLFKE